MISYELPKVEEDGFVVKVAQNVSSADFTESNGVYTVTMVGSGNSYPGICMYFNGEEITSSNVTVSGDYYADWNSLNGTTAKTGAYYEPNGVKGWFSINSCTLVFVYDSVNNTLTITVQ